MLTQTGCFTGQKCTWFHDAGTGTANPIGHIGRAATGTADVGAGCSYGADGPQGFDNCVGGSVCVSGTCKLICDDNGGDPMCPANYACGDYTGLFLSGSMNVAGVCDKTCDPLADNSFGSAGDGLPVKTGMACATGDGCYGFLGTTTPTHATCSRRVQQDPRPPVGLHGRREYVPARYDERLGSTVCAQGYIPLLDDTTGSSVADCIAFCAPADCFKNTVGQTVAATCARTASQAPAARAVVWRQQRAPRQVPTRLHQWFHTFRLPD